MNSTRDYLRSQRVVKKRRKQAMRRMVVLLVLAVLILGGLAGLTHVDALTLQTVEVKGNQVVPSQQISTKVLDMLENSGGFIVSRKNILLYPSEQIEQKLRNEYPRFSSVVVHAVSPTKIEVLVSERKPTSLWCKQGVTDHSAGDASTSDQAIGTSTTATSSRALPLLVQTSDGEQCYFIDAEGYIFSLAPNFQGTAYLKFYGGQLSAQPIGQALVSSSTYASLSALADNMQKHNLTISYITVKDAHTFHIKVQGNGQIYFNDEGSLETAFNNLLAALSNEVFKGQQFEYIDVRFGNKVFFKLKGQAQAATTSASSTE